MRCDVAQPTIDKKILEQVRNRLAVALARARADVEEEEAPHAVRRIRFELMAAEGGLRRLPRTVVSTAEDEPLEARFERLGEALQVSLAAVGAPAVRRLRERMASLVSHDKRVDYSFRFDKRGQARFRLSGEAEIENSLSDGFDVHLAAR